MEHLSLKLILLMVLLYYWEIYYFSIIHYKRSNDYRILQVSNGDVSLYFAKK